MSKSLVLAAGKLNLDPEKPKYFHLLKINNPNWLTSKGFLHKSAPKENADVLKKQPSNLTLLDDENEVQSHSNNRAGRK